MANMKVRDLMTEDVISLTSDDSMAALYDVMSTRNIRHVPIVDDEGDLVGLVSHRDLMARVFSSEQELPLSALQQSMEDVLVQDVMVDNLVTSAPEDDLIDAAQLMLDNKLGSMPVTEGDRLVGILTESDFVRYVSENQG